MSNSPNILIFHVDNINVGDFGCYGGLIRAARKRRISICSPKKACNSPTTTSRRNDGQPIRADDREASSSHGLYHGAGRCRTGGVGSHNRWA